MTAHRGGIFIVFAAAVSFCSASVFAEKEKPPEKKRDPKELVQESRNEKNETKNQQKKEEADKSLSDIDKTWMQEIQGRENSEGNPGNSKPEKSSSGTDEVRLQNPGVLPANSEEGPSFISTAFRFVALLAVMLGGLYLVVRFIRMRNPSLMPAGDLATVMATIPLVQGKFLQIVDLAGRLVVLGVSDHGVNMIMPLDDAVTADRIRLWHRDRGRVVPASWAELLTKSIKKADFKFWEQKTARDVAPDFKEMLLNLGARTEPGDADKTDDLDAALSMPDDSKRRTESPAREGPAAKSRAAKAPGAEPSVPPRPTAGLEALLARQKKKLEQIKTEAAQNEIGFPDRS